MHQTSVLDVKIYLKFVIEVAMCDFIFQIFNSVHDINLKNQEYTIYNKHTCEQNVTNSLNLRWIVHWAAANETSIL